MTNKVSRTASSTASSTVKLPDRLSVASVASVGPVVADSPVRSPGDPLRVALIGEGAYPYQPGGVSLWCHQLVQGMPEHRFTAVALTVDGTETMAWQPSPNLVEVIDVPLWTARPHRGARPGPPLARFGLRVGARRPDPGFDQAYDALLRVLIRPWSLAAPTRSDPAQPDRTEEFLAALVVLFERAQAGRLRSALLSNQALDRLLAAWQDAGLDAQPPQAPGAIGPLSLRDAIAALDQLEHLLRPLSHPPVSADVCHLSMNGLSVLVALAAKWTYGTPMVLSEHGVYLRERYLGLAAQQGSHPVNVIMLRFFRELANAGYRSADVLAPHSLFNRRWQLRGGAQESLMQTMYNGIDPDDFPLAQGEPQVPTIVFVGRIDPLKDLHTLIKAFALVRAELPDARLRMFGPVTASNEQYHAGCLRLISELGLDDSAVFEGRVPRQVDAYQAGHLVALTSVSEGFPFTVVESMSTGRPQVCTDVGGVSEAVGDAGFVVPPRDHVAVAAACLRLLRDDGLRGRLGTLARQRVLERFTLDQWTDAYRAIYRDLVPAPRPAGPSEPPGTPLVIDLRDTAAQGASAPDLTRAGS